MGEGRLRGTPPDLRNFHEPMSGAPRTRRSGRRDRPSALRLVLRTIAISAVVLAAGYVTGLLIGRALL